MQNLAVSELLVRLINLNTNIHKGLSGPLSCHGISVAEYFVLRQLNLTPDKKMRRIDLANEVGLSASGITRMLAPMEKTGLVSKEEAQRDARVSLVALTSAGERIFNDAHVSFAQAANNILGGLSANEQASLDKIASKLL